ncbi:MAG: DNA-binding response regulator [Arcobacter sp.]|nr:DNA-binding response regulator [Arcobacter sp.]|tara:strand:+ start:15390 stop:16094 length:705 start_codon:yes stop_codon:yes gene_type:complete
MIENKLILLKELTVLLVDDQKELIETLSITLSLFFKEVITSSDGEEALEIFKHNPIDVIITDYVMPKMSGYDLCSEIRSINKKIPIAIMSNYIEQDKLLNVIPLNISEYIVKPITYHKLLKILLKVASNFEDENTSYEKITDTIVYNIKLKKLLDGKKEISLSNSEIKVIELFIKKKNVLLTNDEISYTINKDDNKSIQAIKNIIHRIRQKIGKDTIINIQNVGYIFKDTSKEN